MESGYVLIRTVVAFHSASVCSFAFGTTVEKLSVVAIAARILAIARLLRWSRN